MKPLTDISINRILYLHNVFSQKYERNFLKNCNFKPENDITFYCQYANSLVYSLRVADKIINTGSRAVNGTTHAHTNAYSSALSAVYA